jgi:DNA recombination protein RmuC
MTPFEIVILILILFLGGIIWLAMERMKTQSQTQEPIIEWLKTTQGEVQKLQNTLTATMQQSDKNVTDTLQKSYIAMNERLENATRVISELKNETGKFSEIGRSMQSLQDFLNSPKLRGNIGEQILADLMAQVLPKDAYETQHRFRSGDIVDAIIKTKAGIIPVDSKFPMENYTKMNHAETKKDQDLAAKAFAGDVKKHIKAIAEKYINTAENTVDFALMYVPAESVYYEITANQPEVTTFAQELRVLAVSPSTFYAFLRTILVSFEGQRIAQEASAILGQLRTIQKDAVQFSGKLDTLSRHITNAYNNMSTVSNDFNQLQTKINSTNTLGSGITRELP